jgi:hypothetical protein
VWGCPERNVAGALTLIGGVFYESFEYMGTLPISCPSSLIIATRRSGSSSGLAVVCFGRLSVSGTKRKCRNAPAISAAGGRPAVSSAQGLTS